MDTLKGVPERGWPRVGHFLARARVPRSARQAAADTNTSIRTIQAYENAESDWSRVPPLMATYAQKIAGWTEADIIAIYGGGDPPARPAAPTGRLGGAGEPISEETQAQALAAIYSLRDVPLKDRKYLASIIESLPLQSQKSQDGSQETSSNRDGAEAG